MEKLEEIFSTISDEDNIYYFFFRKPVIILYDLFENMIGFGYQVFVSINAIRVWDIPTQYRNFMSFV